MRVSVATGRHHKPFPGIVQHLGLPGFDKGFRALFFSYIDKLAVFHGKSFRQLIVFGSENLPIDYKIGTFLHGYNI